MRSELKELLRRYERDGLSGVDRRRLAELVATEEGRRQALASGCPEALFLALAREETQLSAWHPYWERLEVRLMEQTQVKAGGLRTGPLATAAAMIALAFLMALPFLQKSDEPETSTAAAEIATRVFQLRHRSPAEVLPRLHRLMSEEAQLHVSQQRRELEITDKPSNLEAVARALELLDTPPAELRLRVRLLYALGHPDDPSIPAGALRQISAAGEFDSSDYRLEEELLLTPTEGRRYRALLQDRYEVTCFAELSDDGTEIELRSLTIYDRETGGMVRAAVSLMPGGFAAVPTDQESPEGEPLVVVVSAEETD